MSLHSARFDMEKADVLVWTDTIANRVRGGHVNASAVEGLLRSYIESKGFTRDWREKLFAIAMERFTGRPASMFY